MQQYCVTGRTVEQPGPQQQGTRGFLFAAQQDIVRGVDRMYPSHTMASIVARSLFLTREAVTGRV